MSLGLVAISVLSVLLLFPVGIKSQRIARYQIYAGAKVLDLVNTFSDPDRLGLRQQVEAQQLGQAQQQLFRNNLEQYADIGGDLGNSQTGVAMVPPAIAARLDSDGDEIQRIIADGGVLMYAWPRPTASAAYNHWTDDDMANASECQDLVFAVDGYPQQDALGNHPCLAWPYYDFYPSPAQPWERSTWQVNAATWGAWNEFQALDAICHAGWIDDGSSDLLPANPVACDDYVRKAQALVAALGIPCVSLVPKPPADLSTRPAPWSPSDGDVFPRPAWTLAIRYLAHAAALRTRPDWSPTSAQSSYAQAVHDSCLAWATRYSSADSYDWGAPRVLNRQTAWDFPLLEYDLFPSAAYPSWTTADSEKDVSWRVIGGSQPHAFGHARGAYGTTPIGNNHAFIANSFGDTRHFDLCARFDAAERTRQIVCWAADWKSYEDCEEAPAAPPDARTCIYDSRGKRVSPAWSLGIRPERELFFKDATRTSIYDYQAALADGGAFLASDKAYWLGAYGADRNGNGKLDHGPLPRSIRLRATTVARFNYYDRRLYLSLRK